jgi:alanine transaminase
VIIRNPQDGILIPIPQYPLYTATLALLGGQGVPYYLDESKGWSFDVNDLAASVAKAKNAGITPRAMVMINPGNPTGQVLKKSNLKEVIAFCHDNRLVLLADEVYQANIYGATPFVSAKRCLHEMGPQYATTTELVSFHSTSKGFLGECGFRGGYMEVENMDPFVKDQLYKLASISLCSNLPGQLMTAILARPPLAGEPSYALYTQERDAVLGSLGRRAKKVAAALNGLEGVTCNDAEGAMYLFPSITLSPVAVAKAAELKMQPDEYYAVKLLEATGLCVVPGSGFGQKDGTWHLRTTFLPPEDKIEAVATRMAVFHKQFMANHRGDEQAKQAIDSKKLHVAFT